VGQGQEQMMSVIRTGTDRLERRCTCTAEQHITNTLTRC
jgi:hypothetical protein